MDEAKATRSYPAFEGFEDRSGSLAWTRALICLVENYGTASTTSRLARRSARSIWKNPCRS
jgi:hypothetical protein